MPMNIGKNMSNQLLDWENKPKDYDERWGMGANRELIKVPTTNGLHIHLTVEEIKAIQEYELPDPPKYLMIPGGYAVDRIDFDEGGNVRISGMAMEWIIELVNKLNEEMV